MDHAVRTPAQYQAYHKLQEVELKHKKANHWVGDDNGQEIGPFIEDADARLCKAALAIFAPDHNWAVFEREGSRE